MKMDIITVAEKFIKFLKANEAYENYIIATNQQKRNKSVISALRNMSSIPEWSPYECINLAFTWDFTDQPGDYWLLLDAEWRELLNDTNTTKKCSYKSIW